MDRIRKFTLAALVALALVAGGAEQSAAYKNGSFDLTEAGQVAGSNPKSFGRESSDQIGFIDDEEIIEQVAGSKGEKADAGRESS